MSTPAKDQTPQTPQPPQWALDAAKALFGNEETGIWLTEPECAELIAKHHAASQRWIPCAERLPELNQDILYCIDDGTVGQGAQAYYCGEWWIVGTKGEEYLFSSVTHWQPAPELPAPPR